MSIDVRKMIPTFVVLLLGAHFCFSATTVTINPSVKFQTIDGFGGFGGEHQWFQSPPFYDNNFLSLVVDSIGMTIIRTEFQPNPEQYSMFTQQIPYFQAIHDYIQARGDTLKAFATIWTPPASMKDNNNDDGGDLLPGDYGAFANYLVSYIQDFKTRTGFDLYGLGPENEPQGPETYNSCVYTTDQFAELIDSLAPRIKAAKLPTWIMFSDDFFNQFSYNQSIESAIHSDVVADSCANIRTMHYSGADDNTSMLTYRSYGAGAKAYNKRAWNTEFGNGGDDWDSSWINSKNIYQMLYYGYSAVVFWCIGNGASGQEDESLMFNLTMGPKAYGAKAFFRYIRPGMVRVGLTSSDSTNVRGVAFVHPTKGTNTIVLENWGTASQQVTVSGVGLPASMNVYTTGSGSNCVKTGTIAPGGTVTVAPQFVVTLTGQGSVGINHSGWNPVQNSHVASTTLFSLDGRKLLLHPDQNTICLLHGACLKVTTFNDGSQKIQPVIK